MTLYMHKTVYNKNEYTNVVPLSTSLFDKSMKPT